MKKFLKILLDIIMTIIMIMLMNTAITGINWHEILGIAIFFVFIIHKILNRKWIVAITKNFFKKQVNVKTKIAYVLDVLLLILVTANVITGILISKTILINITVSNIQGLGKIHKFLAWWSLITIAIHIGFHLQMIIDFLKKTFKVTKESKIFSIISKVFYVIVAISGIYSLTKNDVNSNLLLKKGNGLNKEFNNEQKNKEIPPDMNFDEKPDFTERKGRGNKYNNTDSSTRKKNSTDDESASTSTITTQTLSNITTSGGTPTLEDYLSQFNCNGCGKHCVLTNPQCGTGRSYQTEKVQLYNETYNTDEEYDSSTEKENVNIPNFRENNFEKISDATSEGTSLIDYLSIMGLFIGGTHYILKLTDKIKIKNKKDDENKQ